MNLSKRKNLRLPQYDYTQAGGYFVTMCTFEHLCLFGKIQNCTLSLNDCGRIAHECWEKIPTIYSHIQLDEFIVMPNHIHGILIIDDKRRMKRDAQRGDQRNEGWANQREEERARQCLAPTLGVVIGQFKSVVTKRMNALRDTPGTYVWQRNYHDHIIRDEMDLNRIRKYIRDNPREWKNDTYYLF